MLYLAALILLTVIAYFLTRNSFERSDNQRGSSLSALDSELKRLSLEFKELKAENSLLSGNVSETIALYNITKDISRQLDQNKIFSIFKERIHNYIKFNDCRLLENKEDLKKYKDYASIPLVIDKDTSAYLVASGIEEKDNERLQILAGQLLIMLRRSLLYRRIQELAIMDGLTQVFGRRHFLERLNEEVKRSKKFKHNLSFLMVDIDRFKSFNDRYGHLVGDAILREVSQVIRETVRQIDFVGRYGGEELSVALPETDKDQALLAAERIRHAVESRNIKVYDEELKVTISVGLSTFPDDANDSSPLIENADSALYRAKDAGRNRVCAFRK
ncbi:MAG: GGDEF domain-containing protein [Candidatus Omnitrophica bacterium]|nr:GGDEF domain-containing protein [Candidatus Omnitrophota bacterium]